MKPKNIEGYMGKGPLRWLEEQGSRHDVIVEVGAWLGRGTAALARRCATGTIYSVDTWEGVPDDDQQQGLYAHVSDPYKVWEANVRPFILSGAVVPQRGTSLEIAAEWLLSGKRADMVFIDADHRYGAVFGRYAGVERGASTRRHPIRPRLPLARCRAGRARYLWRRFRARTRARYGGGAYEADLHSGAYWDMLHRGHLNFLWESRSSWVTFWLSGVVS
jgi:hypothetical protein